MPRCFVIQPFDEGGRFDKRYRDIVAPAIESAGLEPYRVDRDPTAVIPINQIEEGIESAEACIADISLDKPNVWFELGFAIAAKQAVVLICSSERSTFPFDVQHRSIIRYQTDSLSDFADLRSKIEAQLLARLGQSHKLNDLALTQSVAKVEGLSQHHMAALVAVAERTDGPGVGIQIYEIRNAMERAGFTNIATTLGIQALLEKSMLEVYRDVDSRQFDENEVPLYRPTEAGLKWLAQNEDKLMLKREPKATSGRKSYVDDDDVPF